MKKKPSAKDKNVLTPKQERFCLEYMLDLNATQAAIRAGYSSATAQEQSSRLLSKAIVKQKIQLLKDEQAKRLKVDSDDILRELSRIGYSDIRAIYNENGTVKHPTEWPEDLARAIASIEVEETFEGYGEDRVWTGYTKKVKFWPKNHGLELLGKHKVLFTEKRVVEGKLTLEDIVAAQGEDEEGNE
jgi:phage terminase small subunit